MKYFVWHFTTQKNTPLSSFSYFHIQCDQSFCLSEIMPMSYQYTHFCNMTYTPPLNFCLVIICSGKYFITTRVITIFLSFTMRDFWLLPKVGRKVFWMDSWHLGSYGSATKDTRERRLPEMLHKQTRMMVWECSNQGRVHWEGIKATCLLPWYLLKA